MNQVRMSETELEKGTGAFMKAAATLPGRVIAVNNGMVSAGGIEISTRSILFQQLIKIGWIKPCSSGYEVTDLGVAFACD